MKLAPQGLQDVTPSCWPRTATGARFLLQVEESGEKALLTQALDPNIDLLTATILSPSGALAHSKRSIDHEISNSGCTEISYAPISPIPVRHIGGLVLHVNPDSMDLLTNKLFPPRE